MAGEGTLGDLLGLYYTGGSSNTDPDACLGGAPSSKVVNGLGAQFVSGAIPALRIDRVLPANPTGSVTFSIDSSGNLVYTDSGGNSGSAVTIAAGETKLLSSSTNARGVVVTRVSGYPWVNGSVATFKLLAPLNGVLSMGNLTSAERAAGKTTYRAIMLGPISGTYTAYGVVVWLPTVAGLQSTYSIASEAPASSGAIQTIADEETAPTGLSWVAPSTKGAGLSLGDIGPGDYVGLWIRRAFPAAGAVNASEDVSLGVTYKDLS